MNFVKNVGRISLLLTGLVAASIFAVTPAKAQFSGCGAGVFGGGTIGTASISAIPVGLFADGWSPGVTGECGWKFGSMYLGAGVDYSWQYGDLEKIGVKNDLTIFAKAGVVVSNTAMVYAHGGWTRLSTSGPDIDGWKAGLGSEIKLSNTPLYLDLRYTYAVYDAGDIHPSLSVVDLTGHSFRVGLNVKLGPGMFGGKGPVFSNEDYSRSEGCDPKIDRGCKK